MHFIEIKLR